jgi:hypothetical protein
MNKSLVKELKSKAESTAEKFSISKREGNFNNEIFKVLEIIPMSDHTATVIMKKNTGKKAAFFFYYLNRGMSKGWHYFVPTDSHILGMQSFNFYKLEIERNNYKENFNER